MGKTDSIYMKSLKDPPDMESDSSPQDHPSLRERIQRSELWLKIWKRLGRLRTNRLWFYLWNHLEIIDFDTLYGATGYYLMRENYTSAEKDINTFHDLVSNQFDPESVIDFGCGVGYWLRPFYEEGLTVRGVEASQAAINNAVIPAELIERYDLREPYESDRHYELVLCLEVLEHIPEKYDRVITESIAAAGRTAIISAAPPGQGGTYHVNEQPPEYWKDRFQEVGMNFDYDSTNFLREEFELQELNDYRRENLLVFRRT